MRSSFWYSVGCPQNKKGQRLPGLSRGKNYRLQVYTIPNRDHDFLPAEDLRLVLLLHSRSLGSGNCNDQQPS